MEGPQLGLGGEDITWPDQVAPRGRKASSTRKIKPQTSNLVGDRGFVQDVDAGVRFHRRRLLGTGSCGGGPCPARAPSDVEDVDDILTCGRLAVPLLGLW